jgi:hypothetical protein
VVVLTDEEDCSSHDFSHLVPAAQLSPDDPRAGQGLNLRCHFEAQRGDQSNLYDVARYAKALQALREGNEQLVTFAALVGVPTDLVDANRLGSVNFADAAARDAFYAGILADPRMQEVVDERGPGPEDDNLRPSCLTDMGTAYPPRRIVEVAQGFGPNGLVQSICQADLGPALTMVAQNLTRQLGAVCLPWALDRGDDGLTECEVFWELPVAADAPPATPTQCSQLPFLAPAPDDFSEGSSARGEVCEVAQLAVKDDGSGPRTVPTKVEGTTLSEGWYYDDFSARVLAQCEAGLRQRIEFSAGARPPTGVSVRLRCPSALVCR